MEKKAKNLLIRNIVLAVLFIAAITFVSIKYAPEINNIIQNRNDFKEFILSYGYLGGLIAVVLQVIQIVIPVLPGEVAQISIGYVFGTIWGSVYLAAGALIGTIIVFYAARLIGYPIVKVFVSKEKMDKFNFLANSNKIEITMFLLFLIPAIPKDVLVYIAGLTPVKPSRFFIISVTARIPAIVASAYIGSSFAEGDIRAIIIMSAITVVLLIAGFLFRNKILRLLNRVSASKVSGNNESDANNV